MDLIFALIAIAGVILLAKKLAVVEQIKLKLDEQGIIKLDEAAKAEMEKKIDE